MSITKKYVVEISGLYLITRDDNVNFTSKIREATLFDDEDDAMEALENETQGENDYVREQYKVIGLTGNEFFALMTK